MSKCFLNIKRVKNGVFYGTTKIPPRTLHFTVVRDYWILISYKGFNNLSKEERNALCNLIDDPTIIIKDADKGSSVVVWDRADYLQEAPKMLLSNNPLYPKQKLKNPYQHPLL